MDYDGLRRTATLFEEDGGLLIACCDGVLPLKWFIACAITNSAVDTNRRAAGLIKHLCRLLIQTPQMWSLPLRYPKLTVISAAVDLMIEQQ